MAIPVTPRRSQPGYASIGSTQTLIAVGYLADTDFNFAAGPVLPFAVLAGASTTSAPIVVSGWDSFTLYVDFAGGGGTSSWAYQILDSASQVALIDRSIVAASAPVVGGQIYTFGAQASTAPAATRGDVFHLITIKVTANAANQIYSRILMWTGVR